MLFLIQETKELKREAKTAPRETRKHDFSQKNFRENFGAGAI